MIALGWLAKTHAKHMHGLAVTECACNRALGAACTPHSHHCAKAIKVAVSKLETFGVGRPTATCGNGCTKGGTVTQHGGVGIFSLLTCRAPGVKVAGADLLRGHCTGGTFAVFTTACESVRALSNANCCHVATEQLTFWVECPKFSMRLCCGSVTTACLTTRGRVRGRRPRLENFAIWGNQCP